MMGNNKKLSREEIAKRRLQESLNVEFRKTVCRKYRMECKRKSVEPTFEGLLQFAHDHALIREKDVNRYMVLDLYPKALYDNDGSKLRAVADLEDIVPVSDRTIWSWINDFCRRYRAYRHGKNS